MTRPRQLVPLLALLALCAAARPAPAPAPAAAPPDAAAAPRRGGGKSTPRHYRIHTDLDFELANDLSQRLDAMYEAYAWRLRLFREDGQQVPRFEVYLYRNQRDYLQLTGNRMKHTGGVFISGRNLLASFLEGQGRDS